MTKSNQEINLRVIGLDCHPDTFTACILRGNTPANAILEKNFSRIDLLQLEIWAKKHTLPEDIIVLEASGNSFHIARSLHALGCKALVLESCQMGRLKVAHANNDKISAVRIAKAYLAGTAKEVWVPDLKTQERRDWLLAYLKAVKRTTQLQNRIQSYLSDQGVRSVPKSKLYEEKAKKKLRARGWTPRQWQVIEGMLMEMRHADEQRKHWESLISQEVLEDAVLLSLMRLCGVRDIIAFAIGAIVGDVNRFAGPKKLVNYIGLAPAFDDSGESEWTGGIGCHGRKDLRGLLIQGAQAVIQTKTPLGQWGRKLILKKGQRNLAVAAVARRMAVSIWYLLQGRWTGVEELEPRLEIKINKVLTHVGAAGFKALKKTRKQLREEARQRLKTGRVYYLDPNKKMPPKTKAAVPV